MDDLIVETFVENSYYREREREFVNNINDINSRVKLDRSGY